MRLRSSGSGGKEAGIRGEASPLAIVHSNDGEPPLLPEQTAAVRARQQETGRSFEEVAIELGYLPEAALDRRRRTERASPSISGDAAEELDPLVVMVSNPDDPLVGASRELRTLIGSMERRDGSPVRRVALLALNARAENSLLAANLAAAFAMSGQSTLLIDANFGAPVQHGLFKRPQDNGVVELLQSKVEPARLIQSTVVPMLDLITVGGSSEVIAELTDRSALALATEQISENYSTVIVDAGAADHVGTSCASGFDGIILIVQRARTSLRDARKLVDRLRAAGDVPVGTVIID